MMSKIHSTSSSMQPGDKWHDFLLMLFSRL